MPDNRCQRLAKTIVILDARHVTERRYLRRHLRDLLDGEPPVVLTLSDESAPLDLTDLRARLAAAADDCAIVPARLAWQIRQFDQRTTLGLRDLLFGDPRRPGAIRAGLILLSDRRRARLLTGESATVGALKARFHEDLGGDLDDGLQAFAAFVARQATLTLDLAERSVRGARYKVPRHVAASLQASPRFRAALSELARTQAVPAAALLPEARKYMHEIISRPSALFLDLRARLERFMMTQGYSKGIRIDPAEMESLRDMIRTRPTVILFTHKTYLDAITPNVLAYDNDMTMLHSFGGINLDFFGLGTLFRRSGVIFIRRTFQDLPVYKMVLRTYIAYLLEKRFPMSWALEGTRSRLGKLMPPKYGILKYVIDAARTGGIDNLHIVPLVTSFDLIRDVEEYAAEQTGRVKKPESISWFIRYLRSLREPMGRVRIDLGKPVVVSKAPDPEDRLALSKLAFDAAVSANRATPITVTSLMCLALLGTAPRGATADELILVTRILTDWARARGIRLSDELESSERGALKNTVDTLVHSGLIARFDTGSDRIYTIEPAKQPIASYYRNTIIHHFVDKSFIELALFRLTEAESGDPQEAFWDEILQLRNLFKFEFFYPPREQFRREIEAELERVAPGWAAAIQGGPQSLRRLIRRFQPLVGHAALLPFVEAYSVVFDMLCQMPAGTTLSQAECAKRGLIEGRRAYLLRQISSEASIGKILFENAYALAASLGLTEVCDAATLKQRRAVLAQLKQLAWRMERMRIEALAEGARAMDIERRQ